MTDFTADELSIATRSLFDTLSAVISLQFEARTLETEERDLLRSYLSAYWLRPGNALLQALEARALGPFLPKDNKTIFLDLGCGDGVNSSLLSGWRFESSFDVFTDLNLQQSDIYDAHPSSRAAPQFRKKGLLIDYGVDIKMTMVEKAHRLGTFRETIHAEASSLPIRNDSIDILYSNVLRDFPDDILKSVLSDCARVLSRNGLLIFSAPTEQFRQFLSYYTRATDTANRSPSNINALLRLDRGRSSYSSQQITVEQWSKHLHQHGLEIDSVIPFASRNVLEIWDTCLRPYVPFFVRCLDSVSHENRLLLKETIITFFECLFSPIYHRDNETTDTAFRIITARKS